VLIGRVLTDAAAPEPTPMPSSERPRSGSLASLSHPVFRAVWITSLASNFGGLIQSVGASWMMTSMGSAQMVALVQASTTLPVMLLSLLAGAMADTSDRRLVMLYAQGFMLVVSVALAAATWLGWINPWLLLLFTFLIGVGTAFNGPAWQASVGDMVPRDDLPGAVTLNAMGFNIARSLGPAIGGLIVAAAGAATAFAVNAVSYIGLIIVIARWRPERPPQTLAREGLWHAMGAAVRYAAMSPRVYAVLLRAAIFGLGAVSIQALLPLVARETVGGGPLIYGLLLGAFGMGAVAGAFGSGRLRSRFSTEVMSRITCTAFGVSAVVVGLSPWLALTLPALAVSGAAWVLTLSAFNVTVQMSVPRWVVARALALYQMAAFGGMALGSWVWGAVADGQGVGVALCASAVVLGICVMIGLRLPLPTAGDLNLDPLSRWTEPRIAVEVEPRSGPVVISIEYRIDEDRIPEFLEVMNERRRIRRRDGARHWTLLRDLGDPIVWVERYHTPTWVDYVRYNQRLTQADAEISERIAALHTGPERPLVHRLIERSTGQSFEHGDAPAITEPLTDAIRSA
jgi:MFS family permease